MFNNTRLMLPVSLALLAFAANSLLCRWALGHYSMDPILFTEIRLIAGAVILALICRLRHPGNMAKGHAGGAVALLFYALCFSLAYTGLSTGTGALILFATVQLSLLAWIFIKGGTLQWRQYLGMVLALTGLVYLCLPSLAAPPLWAALLMGVAGIAWAIYTLIGKALNTPPLQSNYRHFLLASLLCLPALGLADINQLSAQGISLALISGAVTSGLGYAIWYQVLPSLPAFSAAVLQLSVPILAALLGILVLGEQTSFDFLLASGLILGGILLGLLGQMQPGLRQ